MRLIDALIARDEQALRDTFAAQAMQGMLSNPHIDTTNAQLVAEAYRIADAMLRERAK